MGALTSRQRAGVEEIDVGSSYAYQYPPKSGNYFGSHFIMGGERFDTPQPESYLFGENYELNFLGRKPTPFPYPPPQPNEPTKTLKCLVNIRKESLRFVRAPMDVGKPAINKGKKDSRDVELGKGAPVNIEFTFDCDVRCAITIYYFCKEEYTPNGVTYIPRDPSLVSETYHYKKGANQQFCQMSHIFDPSLYTEDDFLYDMEKEIIPIAIHVVAEDMRQSHTTFARAEKLAEGIYLLKALKQKLFVDGLCYLLQEIYGIENKNNDKHANDDEVEDNGSECVICMCDVRDTLILPCRHLCVCNSCADSLRYQASNCPICRAPFRALLQIRALHKANTSNLVSINTTDTNLDNIPSGYEAVSLIEALNGPCVPKQPPSAVPDLVETPESEHAIQAAQILNRQIDRHSKNKYVAPEMMEASLDNIPSGYEAVSLIEALNGPCAPQQPSPAVPYLRETAESTETSQILNRQNDRHAKNKYKTPEMVQTEYGNLMLEKNGDGKENTKHPLLLEKDEFLSNRPKHHRSKDNLKLVNEKKASKVENTDEDSETEKLSPLLRKTSSSKNLDDFHLTDIEIVGDLDDNSKNLEKIKGRNADERGDESDYYTPEESAAPIATGIASLTYEEDNQVVNAGSSVESTPQHLPGTPHSHSSSRSSGDSCSSGSSTRHLLSVVSIANGQQDKGVHI